jgi:hypothetical protein
VHRDKGKSFTQRQQAGKPLAFVKINGVPEIMNTLSGKRRYREVG